MKRIGPPFFVTAFFFISISHAIELGIHSKGAICNSFLERIIETKFPNHVGADLSTVKDLEQSMSSAYRGHPQAKEMAAAISELVKRAIEGDATKLPPIVRHVQQELNAAKDNPNQLQVCLLSGVCEEARSAHVPGNLSFDIVPSGKGISENTLTKWLKTLIKPRRPPPGPDHILMPLPKHSSLDWTEAFFEEATHMADFKLVERWIQTNRALENAGAKTDELYQKYVKQKGDRTQVDEAFLRVFLESRGGYGAVLLQKLALRDAFTPDELNDLMASREQDFRSNAETALRTYRGVPHFLDANNLSGKDLIKVGLEWGEIMEHTISGQRVRDSIQSGLMAATPSPIILSDTELNKMEGIFGGGPPLSGKRVGRPLELGDTFLLPHQITAARKLLQKQGGDLRLSSSQSSSLFIVDDEGQPQIGLVQGAGPGTLRIMMKFFNQWQNRRDQLVAEGFSLKDAGLPAELERQTPLPRYLSYLDAMKTMSTELGTDPLSVFNIPKTLPSKEMDREEAVSRIVLPEMEAALSAERILVGKNEFSGKTVELGDTAAKVQWMQTRLIDLALVKYYLSETVGRRNKQLRLQNTNPALLNSGAESQRLTSSETPDSTALSVSNNADYKRDRWLELFGIFIYQLGKRYADSDIGDSLLKRLVERDRILRKRMGAPAASMSPQQIVDQLKEVIAPEPFTPKLGP